MGKTLKDKTVIVTGASAGIGWATALALAEQGASLILTARRADRLAQLTKEARDRGAAEAISVVGDARKQETADRAVKTALDKFGYIDILVNNAGMGSYKDLVDTSVEEYDEIMDTNMRSTFVFTRAAVPAMLKRGAGTILMVSSMAGLYGFPSEAVYCASKFAQVGFVQALDRELRSKGIKVGVICPGGVKTEFALGKGRTEAGVAASGMLEPEDVAKAIEFACAQGPNSRIIEIQLRTMSESLV